MEVLSGDFLAFLAPPSSPALYSTSPLPFPFLSSSLHLILCGSKTQAIGISDTSQYPNPFVYACSVGGVGLDGRTEEGIHTRGSG